jgi:hypothetical protein
MYSLDYMYILVIKQPEGRIISYMLRESTITLHQISHRFQSVGDWLMVSTHRYPGLCHGTAAVPVAKMEQESLPPGMSRSPSNGMFTQYDIKTDYIKSWPVPSFKIKDTMRSCFLICSGVHLSITQLNSHITINCKGTIETMIFCT